MTTDKLAVLSAVEQRLATISTVDEAKAIRDQAEAIRVYAKNAKKGLTIQNRCAAIKLLSERRAGELLAKMERREGRPRRGQNGLSMSRFYKDSGIAIATGKRWQTLATLPDATIRDQEAACNREQRELTSAALYAEIAQSHRREKRVEDLATIAKGNTALGIGARYPIIYADPPWQYEHVKTESRAIENHYPTMPLAEICALEIGALATDDAVLFLWATSPKLAEAMQVITAWGFTYRTCAVWDKGRIGMGYWFRQQHELLLVSAKGAPPMPETAARPASVIQAPRGDHSVKPIVFCELIESMYPTLPRIELFARTARAGWDRWGNQTT